MIHLDNHQVEAGWCCNSTDGNGWFGYGYFNVDHWMRGLEYMAKYVSGALVPTTRSTVLCPMTAEHDHRI